MHYARTYEARNMQGRNMQRILRGMPVCASAGLAAASIGGFLRLLDGRRSRSDGAGVLVPPETYMQTHQPEGAEQHRRDAGPSNPARSAVKARVGCLDAEMRQCAHACIVAHPGFLGVHINAFRLWRGSLRTRPRGRSDYRTRQHGGWCSA